MRNEPFISNDEASLFEKDNNTRNGMNSAKMQITEKKAP